MSAITRSDITFEPMALKERVRAARLQAGLSQSELARRIRVRPSAVNHIESGRTKAVKAETLLAIAAACGVSANWLETGSGAATPEARLVPEESELLILFRSLSEPHRHSLLAVARSLLDAQTPDPTPVSPFSRGRPAKTRT